MKKLVLALCLAAFLAAGSTAVAVIPRYSTDPDDFVQSKLQHFWVNGQPFRFVGYNVRGLAHYGTEYFGANASDREANLAYMETVGAKVARIFLAYKRGNSWECSNALETALQAASQHNVRLIVAFMDEYDGPNFYLAWDSIHYTNGLLNATFFASGYNSYYLPFVQSVVNRFKNDPTVFAWQVGNEMKCPWNPGDILPFSHSVATTIRSIDQNHMVSFGTAGRSFSGLTTTQATQLYADYEFLTIHPYNGSDSNNDSGLADTLRKPLLVSEAGFESGNRPAATDADIAKWVSRGARGYMNWGLMVVDNGDGDTAFGIDHNHSDFDAYTAVYQSWATALADTPLPAPHPPTGMAASDGAYADRVRITWNPTFAATEYAVSRATSVGGTKTQISPWQTGCSFDNTSITRGTTYYYWVRARNSGGTSGYSAYDMGYAANAPDMTISALKSQPDGTLANVIGGMVTATYNGAFYIEQADRASAISVAWLGAVQEGERVTVLGAISTLPSGERRVTATSVSP